MSKIKVFIVEDDPMVISINQRFTERLENFQVVGTARTGAQALAELPEVQPDLVLLDVYLPDMSGIDVLKGIRQAGLSADVILITAAHDTATIAEALRYGACDYLIKPFQADRFKKAFDSYLLRRTKLHTEKSLNQKDFDSMFNEQRKKAMDEEPVPKGIDEVTLKRFMEFLAEAKEPLSANEVAEQLGVSRITAHRYLGYLSQQGKVIIQPIYGSVGRPIRKYLMP